MDYRELGKTGVQVSEICLGTMTWGEQNSEQEAFEQLDYARSQGVNFIDAAEMYPVPPRPETQGLTEQYLGNWMNARGCRSECVVATKAAGPADWLSHIRGGPSFSREQLFKAVESSLTRLQTDYIDLYQLHWPSRQTNFFGHLGFDPEASDNDSTQQDEIRGILDVLAELVKQGKIRHIGLSNETAWGVMKFVSQSDGFGLPKVVSVQNPYNLLNRSFEVGLAEVAHRESVGLLAYSPLAFGVLSGKYLDGARPENARLTLFDRFSRYTSDHAMKATQAYVDLANEQQMSPAQLSLAYVTSRRFVTSNIIGATTMSQLEENIASHKVCLSADVLDAIEKIHQQYTYPCP